MAEHEIQASVFPQPVRVERVAKIRVANLGMNSFTPMQRRELEQEYLTRRSVYSIILFSAAVSVIAVVALLGWLAGHDRLCWPVRDGLRPRMCVVLEQR